MKYFVLLGILATAYCIRPLNEKEQTKLGEAHKICGKDNNLQLEQVIQALSGELKNAQTIDYVFCAARFLNYVDENGKINKEAVIELETKLLDSEYLPALYKAVDDCDFVRDTPQESGFDITSCLFKAVT